MSRRIMVAALLVPLLLGTATACDGTTTDALPPTRPANPTGGLQATDMGRSDEQTTTATGSTSPQAPESAEEQLELGAGPFDDGRAVAAMRNFCSRLSGARAARLLGAPGPLKMTVGISGEQAYCSFSPAAQLTQEEAVAWSGTLSVRVDSMQPTSSGVTPDGIERIQLGGGTYADVVLDVNHKFSGLRVSPRESGFRFLVTPILGYERVGDAQLMSSADEARHKKAAVAVAKVMFGFNG